MEHQIKLTPDQIDRIDTLASALPGESFDLKRKSWYLSQDLDHGDSVVFREGENMLAVRITADGRITPTTH